MSVQQAQNGDVNVQAMSAASASTMALDIQLQGIKRRAHIAVTTKLKAESRGILFAYDPSIHVLALERGDGQNRDYQIIPTSSIQSVVVLDESQGGDPAVFEALSEEVLRRAETKTVQQRKERASKLNADVPDQIQKLFFEIDKTVPCKWANNNTIVVAESVSISAPYTEQNCKGTDPDVIERVKKMLQAARERLKL